MRNFLLKALSGLVVLAVLLVLLAWPALKLFNWYGERALAELGLPGSYEELYPPIPDAENAEPLLLESMSRLTEYPGGMETLSEELHDRLENGVGEETVRRLDAWIEENAEAVALGQAALDRPRYRLRAERFEPASGKRVSISRHLLNLLYIFTLRAVEASRDGRMDEALQNHLAANRIARLKLQDAVCHQDVGVGAVFYSLSFRHILKNFRSAQWSADQLAALLDSLDVTYIRNALNNSIKGDVMSTKNDFRSSYSSLDEGSAFTLFGFSMSQFVFDYFEACSIYASIDMMRKTKSSSHKIYEKHHSRSTDTVQDKIHALLPMGIYKLFSGTITMNEELTAMFMVHHDLRRLNLALELYKKRHGTYPDNLAALAPGSLPALPQDAVTGGLFNYEKSGVGYVLTSEGCMQTSGDATCEPEPQ